MVLNCGYVRTSRWTIRDPSDEAKNFCSSTNRICELTKVTPGTPSAVSFNFIRKAVLVSSGTSKGSRLKELAHVVITFSASASTTLRPTSRAFARAMATACSAVARADAGSTRLLAAKPHTPSTSTRRPRP